jgi:hypothetical protein
VIALSATGQLDMAALGQIQVTVVTGPRAAAQLRAGTTIAAIQPGIVDGLA